EMIVSSNDHETMVAILEEDQLVELFIERERNRGVVGNVYKGRVSKVLPGMQSAFVDLGLERDGFLYVSDVVNTAEMFEQLEGDNDEDPPAALTATGESGGREGGKDGKDGKDKDNGERVSIEELLKEGQEVLVQVVKGPLGTKGARITSHVSIPGRFLVFMPTVDHIGVSRKIESREERARLRGIIRQFREAHNFSGGVIIRTAAAGRPEAD